MTPVEFRDADKIPSRSSQEVVGFVKFRLVSGGDGTLSGIVAKSVIPGELICIDGLALPVISSVTARLV